MRGVEPLSFPVPRGGWRTDLPAHELPPDALADGQNVMVEEDGLLKPRRGYQRLDPQPDSNGDVDRRIVAGISWEESTESFIVISTLTRWFSLQGNQWVDLSGGHPLNGNRVIPARFTQFAFDAITNRSVIYGVNGPEQDFMHRWVVGQPAYETVTPQSFAGLPAIAPFRGTDLCVLANRLIIIDDTVVRWSAINDGTTYHPLAFTTLPGLGRFIAIQPTSRLNAVIYAENGAWSMSAVLASEQAAFVFDKIENVTKAPFNCNSINNVGGVHFYLSNDQHVVRCDGQTGQIISYPVDDGLGRIAMDVEQKPVALFDDRRHRLIWFVAFNDDLTVITPTLISYEAKHAIAFNLFTNSWEPPWKYDQPITAAFPTTEALLGDTWDTWLKYADWPTVGQVYAHWSDVPIGARQEAIYIATLGTVPVFPQWINDAAPGTGDWLIYPDWPAVGAAIPTWNDVQAIGTQIGGIICRWFSVNTDDATLTAAGRPIRYNATWGLRQPVDRRMRYILNLLEVYLNPQTVDELVTFLLDGLATPYDQTPVNLMTQEVDPEVPNTPAGWQFPLDRTIGEGSFKPVQFLRLKIAGVTSGQAMWYAGVMVYGDEEERPDWVAGVTGLP